MQIFKFIAWLYLFLLLLILALGLSAYLAFSLVTAKYIFASLLVLHTALVVMAFIAKLPKDSETPS